MSIPITIALLGMLGFMHVPVSHSTAEAAVHFKQKTPTFTENKGQWDEQVLFRTDAGGAVLWICKDRIVYQFLRYIDAPSLAFGSNVRRRLPNDPLDGFNHEPDSIEQLVITAKFVGSDPEVKIVGEGMMEYKCNYFLGSDPIKWHTDVPSYEAVTLQGIYHGVDLRFYCNENGNISYKYEISPGTESEIVRLEYDGVHQSSVDETGGVTVLTKWARIAGLIAQPLTTEGSYFCELARSSTPGATTTFGLLPKVQRDHQGVGLVYSTFLGGTDFEGLHSIDVDTFGCAYVAGTTYSSDFPTESAYDSSFNGGVFDICLSKLSEDGSNLVYSTFLGGSDYDEGFGVTVDKLGCAFVTGLTLSPNFPTLAAFDSSYNGNFLSDAFVCKISPEGNALVFSTYLGGSNSEACFAIAVDASGSAYVSGETNSQDFPTQSAFSSSFGGGSNDAFLTKFSSNGSSLVYSTYLGGSNGDAGFGLALDESGQAFVTGVTESSDFSTLNALDNGLAGNFDAFVSKIAVDGTSLEYSTYLGGSDGDVGYAIAVTDFGAAFVTGLTYSSDFPVLNAYDSSFNGGEQDAFVTKISSSGDSLVFSTYIGGSESEEGRAIATDALGCAHITGKSYSHDFPIQNSPHATLSGDADVFVSKFTESGYSLVYSALIGGAGGDYGLGIAIDNSGSSYLVGSTFSSNYPILNAFDSDFDNVDGFVTKLTGSISTCGDADGNGIVTISDAVYLINYIFAGGPAPSPALSGDADCNGIVTISDAVYLINYIFAGGAAPCAACQ